MAQKKLSFVVQKHDASHLHYDFRIEIEGVMPSWAVPKGVPLNPQDKRLAIRTPDHPLTWAKFEGIIPEDEYGAGTVMIWDYGTYTNMKTTPMPQCLEEGRIEIWLTGKKLKGGYALIKTHFSETSWLMIKLDDEYAIHTGHTKKTPDWELSAKTGRNFEEIIAHTSGKMPKNPYPKKKGK